MPTRQTGDVIKVDIPGTDVMILKLFSPKISAKKLAFLTQNKDKLCKILIITLVFEKNANFFRRKVSKIAENCAHNIDPWVARFFLRVKLKTVLCLLSQKIPTSCH
jgi:hypothetical protein